eukprot:scaffold22065_cov64-Phaeocystis_antarctica.AAC.1
MRAAALPRSRQLTNLLTANLLLPYDQRMTTHYSSNVLGPHSAVRAHTDPTNATPNPYPRPHPHPHPHPYPHPHPHPRPNQVRAHTGPTNAMLTVQCALSAAPGNWIRVGSEVRPCLQNMCTHHLLTYSPTRLLAYSPYLLTYLSPTLP